jgi:hypothetical protein
VGLPDDLDTSVPSRSAGREHARRKANRERAVRERLPRIGGAVLALTDAPQSERAWLTGQDGEEHVGASLQARVSGHVVLLHDRRIPGSRANIDHIAVAPSGIWVIDTKRYTGRVRVRAPLFGHPKLLIAGRDRSNLADGLAKQVDVVQDARGDSTQVPVYGAFCFVEADLPMLSKLTFRGFPLLYPRQLGQYRRRSWAAWPARSLTGSPPRRHGKRLRAGSAPVRPRPSEPAALVSERIGTFAGPALRSEPRECPARDSRPSPRARWLTPRPEIATWSHARPDSRAAGARPHRPNAHRV